MRQGQPFGLERHLVVRNEVDIDDARPPSHRGLAAELDVPGIAIAPVLERLERSGLIVATEKAQFVPGRDPEGILLADIMDAVRTLQISRLPVEVSAAASVAPVMREVQSAMRERLGARSLKDLIAAKGRDGVGAAT